MKMRTERSFNRDLAGNRGTVKPKRLMQHYRLYQVTKEWHTPILVHDRINQSARPGFVNLQPRIALTDAGREF